MNKFNYGLSRLESNLGVGNNNNIWNSCHRSATIINKSSGRQGSSCDMAGRVVRFKEQTFLVVSLPLTIMLASTILIAIAILITPSYESPVSGVRTRDSNEIDSSKLFNRQRHRRHQVDSSSTTSNNMRIELNSTKRPAGSQNVARGMHKKRFKSSLNSTFAEQPQVTSNDMNNNNRILNLATNDIMNDNTIALGRSQSAWRRNVNSVNGTIDLSQYEQSDVDRLYGDALLVYFKNFNE